MVSQSVKARLKAFYSRQGLRWHGVYELHGAKHISEGLDIEAGAREHVLAISGGRVVARGFSESLGYYVTTDHLLPGPHRFVTYLHIIGPTRKSIVRAGGYVAEVAGVHDPHGTSWTGPHLALHTGPTKISAMGVATTDPATLIKKRLG
jgi:hypothetical protein